MKISKLNQIFKINKSHVIYLNELNHSLIDVFLSPALEDDVELLSLPFFFILLQILFTHFPISNFVINISNNSTYLK